MNGEGRFSDYRWWHCVGNYFYIAVYVESKWEEESNV